MKKYELKENQFGKYFIKNNLYYYLDQFEVYGLDTSLWYDKIDYILYKVKFTKEEDKEFISLRKKEFFVK